MLVSSDHTGVMLLQCPHCTTSASASLALCWIAVFTIPGSTQLPQGNGVSPVVATILSLMAGPAGTRPARTESALAGRRPTPSCTRCAIARCTSPRAILGGGASSASVCSRSCWTTLHCRACCSAPIRRLPSVTSARMSPSWRMYVRPDDLCSTGSSPSQPAVASGATATVAVAWVAERRRRTRRTRRRAPTLR